VHVPERLLVLQWLKSSKAKTARAVARFTLQKLKEELEQEEATP
jgi:hypothetical protein